MDTKCLICGISYGVFEIPSNENSRQKWFDFLRDICDIENITNGDGVCINHFTPDDVIDTTKKIWLKKNVVPSIINYSEGYKMEHPFGIKRCACSVLGCKDRKTMRHRFTKDPELYEKWAVAIQAPRLLSLTQTQAYRYLRVCHIHFEISSFASCSHSGLRRDAVPTLQLPPFSEEFQHDFRAMLERNRLLEQKINSLDWICFNRENGIEGDTINVLGTDGGELFQQSPLYAEEAYPALPNIELFENFDTNVENEVVTSSQESNGTNVCPFCLTITDLEFIHESNFAQDSNNMKFIQRNISDEIPEKVCRKCIDQLGDCVAFLNKCQSSYGVFTRALERLEESMINRRTKQELMDHQYYVKNETLDYYVNEIIAKKSESDKIESNMSICRTCGEVMTSLLSHYQVSQKCKPLKTKFCDSCGAAVRNFQKHLKENPDCHPSDKTVMCHVCANMFATTQQLLAHMVVHEENQKMCHICSKMFKMEASLQRHIRFHLEERVYMCELCGKTVESRRNLRYHQNREHSLIRKFRCRYCNREFSKYKYFLLHEKKHEFSQISRKQPSKGQKPKKLLVDEDFFVETERTDGLVVYKCLICGRSYETKVGARYHVVKTHKTTRSCNKCAIQFDDLDLLREHNRNEHSDDYTATCDICLKKFCTKTSLKCHLRIHTGEKPYQCQFCDKKFRLSNHLTTHHITIHNLNLNTTNPYRCRFCQRCFTLKGNLTAHERIHTGEKPYPCHICQIRFSNPSRRKLHVRKVHGDHEVPNIVPLNIKI